MPLQNRVTPWGEIVAVSARGTFFGNRGGRIHTPDKKLSNRRWASHAWICCVLDFRGRQRQIMSPNSYTELFFLDEVTALSAGHRPCFECRRREAVDFLECHAQAHGRRERMYAADFDRLMQEARLKNAKQRSTRADIATLPDGCMIRWENAVWAVRANLLLEWSFQGYLRTIPRPRNQIVELLTPVPVTEALRFGYKPVFHPAIDM